MKTRLALFALALLAAIPFAVSAQDVPPPAVVADNLHAPRHIFIDNNSNSVYVAEAGVGGDTVSETAQGKVMVGNTGQITRFDDKGQPSPFITGLFSSLSETGEVTGVHAVVVTSDAAWVLVGQGVADMPEGLAAWSLLKYSVDGTELQDTIDLLSYEETENPDAGEIDSNPVDFVIAPDGTIYVADAGGNDVLKIVDGEISTFAVWPPEEGKPQAVPTSLALDADGNLYVGFLTGFPFPKGGAWIEKLDADGKSLERYDGLTMVVDIDLDAEGTLYASEFGEFGEQGPVPGSGRIVKVTKDGIEPVVSGLMFPYGFFSNKGTFVVLNGTSFLPAAQLLFAQPGAVMPMPEAPAPATTEEAKK